MPRMFTLVTTVQFPADCDAVLLGRFRGRGGYPTQATCSAIAWTLANASTEEVIATGTFTVSATVFDSLQTDPLWEKDEVGYNFRGVIPAASIPVALGGDRLQVEVRITMASGEVLRAQFNWPTAKTYG